MNTVKCKLSRDHSILFFALFTPVLLNVLSAEAANSGRGGQGVSAGGGILYPVLDLYTKYDDNILLEEADEIDSGIVIVAPGVKYEFEKDATQFGVEIDAEHGSYLSSHDDDYTDFGVEFDAAYLPTSRMTIGGGANYNHQHEARGTESTLGRGAEVQNPIEFHSSEISGRFAYGLLLQNQPRFELELRFTDKEYVNNRSLTQADDVTGKHANGAFFYMVMPNTSMLVEFALSDYAYENDNRDNLKQRLLAGVEWAATQQTSGLLKLGTIRRDFDQDDFEDPSSFSWEIGVNWKPTDYSSLRLTTFKDLSNSSAVSGSYSENESVSLRWKHYWLDHLSTTIEAGLDNEKFGNNTLKTETKTFDLKVDYMFVESIVVGIGYEFSDRNSNLEGADYTSNVYSLQVSYQP